MNSKTPDRTPRSEIVLDNQIGTYDRMRSLYPVAHSDRLQWSVFRHADVLRILEDHEAFSNAVSRHPSVPNGMDPPEHTGYREIIEDYFGPERMQAFEPLCREIATRLAGHLPSCGQIDLSEFAEDFALEIQCAFMGWPKDLHEPLRQWIRRNHEATLAGDPEATAAVALEFDGYIRKQLEARRQTGHEEPRDVTGSLLCERLEGRLLTDEENISIIRNWTVGELGTIAASIGILAHYLAGHRDLQRQIRNQPSQLPPAIDEILRIHAPLIANRRVTTRTVEIGGRRLEAGERISLIWASANRDESVFGDPDEFRLDRDPSLNLLYGAGIHVCPGAPLARLELRIVMEELLARTGWISLSSESPPKMASYPASGFSSLPLRIDPQSGEDAR